MPGQLSRPTCKCGKPASNLVAYEFEHTGAVAILTCCDGNDCLLWAREQATGDDQASITRIKGSAALFYRTPEPKPQGATDLGPYVCAGCRKGQHSVCDNQVVIKLDGRPKVTQCDCHMSSHILVHKSAHVTAS